MKWLITIIFLFIFSLSIQAQENSVAVMQHFSVEAPTGYVATYSSVSWSPDGTLLAINFDTVDERNISDQSIWLMYDVEMGTLLHQFDEFIAWYSDSSRAIIRTTNQTSHIIDARSGAILADLHDTGNKFADTLIDKFILNLNETNTLRIFDAESGDVAFTLENVAELPRYSPDARLFSVDVIDSGIFVYNAIALTIEYSLIGYSTEQTSSLQQDWSPDSNQLIVMPLNTAYHYFGPRHIWTLGEGLSVPIYNTTSKMVWSPDATQIAVASDFTKIRIYDAVTGDLNETIRGSGDGMFRSLRWEGNYLTALMGDYTSVGLTLIVWDFKGAEFIVNYGIDIAFSYILRDSILEITEPYIGITSISLGSGDVLDIVEFDRILTTPSPDKKWIISSEFPREGEVAPIFVYRFDTLELVARLERHTDIVRYELWSPDSQYFVSVGGPDIVIVWKIEEGAFG